MNEQTLTERKIELIAEAVSAGLTWGRAAQACGVSDRTLRRWRQDGVTRPGTIYAKLVERLEVAEAEFERTHLRRIAAAAEKGTWQAAAWLLERTMPNRYALIKRVETGPPGSFDNLSDEELTAAVLELIPGGKRNGDKPSRVSLRTVDPDEEDKAG